MSKTKSRNYQVALKKPTIPQLSHTLISYFYPHDSSDRKFSKEIRATFGE